MATRPENVLIIGAGLAGPALALQLARHNIRSTIFEVRKERGSTGGSISLMPNALRALDTIGVFEEVCKHGYVYSRNSMHLIDGYRLGFVRFAEDDARYRVVRIMRTKLQDLLIDAAIASGMCEVVRGAKLARITEDADSVTALFEDGTSATGDLLFGCDGIHSKTRDYVLDGKGPTPRHVGACTVAGFIPAADVKLPTGFDLPSFIFTPTGLVMIIPVDAKAETLTWGISQSLEERDREGWRKLEESGEVLESIKQQYGGYESEPLRSIISQIDKHPSHLWPPRELADLATWHRGRVLLIGDAAHAQAPNAQGSAQAFEDAAFLGRLFGSEAAVARGHERLFSHFETVRRKRMETVKKSTKPGSAAKSATDGLLWWAKSWALSIVFALKRGVFQYPTNLTAYDVYDESVEVQ